ncbi:hypothetical protein DFR52_106212 [Hoeflea marina]|uniref:YpeB-like protein with protease inhibitory function n=1 Tax=Hoeflea marina TaxID=274592 RepID=A0A317PDZ6_9HYPH|nr:hypothetical protein [Hoeflea marina]PWV97688.1 hypothetical protein DFR52_106212 [Hoeflea marina]
MNSFIKTALVALSLATAGLSVSAPAASAASIGISIDGSGASVQLVRDHGRNDGWRRDHGRRDDWRRHGPRRDGICAPQRALNKARHMGVHRARVTDADRRIVKVRGVHRGHRVNVIFANARGCPVIGYR